MKIKRPGLELVEVEALGERPGAELWQHRRHAAQRQRRLVPVPVETLLQPLFQGSALSLVPYGSLTASNLSRGSCTAGVSRTDVAANS